MNGVVAQQVGRRICYQKVARSTSVWGSIA